MADSFMNKVYHSGVGWFNDILDVEIFIDTETEAYSAVPHFVKQNPFPPGVRRQVRPARVRGSGANGSDDDGDSGSDDDGTIDVAEASRRSDGKYMTQYVPLAASGVPISGFVRIAAPAGRAVSHNGVALELTTHLYTLEDVSSRDIYEEHYVAAPAGEVDGTVDVPFVFHGPSSEHLDESFEGALFSIRHTISVTVSRPWYTFPVTASTPVLVQRLHNLVGILPPDVLGDLASQGIIRGTPGAGTGLTRTRHAAGAGKGQAAALADDPLASAPQHKLGEDVLSTSFAASKGAAGGVHPAAQPQTLVLTGLAGGAKVTMTLERGLFEVRESISGSITIENASAPIVLLKLALIRMEVADSGANEEDGGAAMDSVVFDQAIVDARNWRIRKEGREALARLELARAKKAAEEARKAAERAAKGLPDPKAKAKARAAAKAARMRGEDSDDDDDDDDDEEEEQAEDEEAGAGAAHDMEAGLAVAVDGGAGAGGGAGATPLAGISDGERAEQDWVPSAEELADPNPDKDLPLVGNQSLAVDLDLNHISNISPTYVIPLGPSDASASSSKGGASAGRSEASVRYYIRLTAYTDFSPSARRWAAQEIVLVRGSLNGQVIPPWRRPKALSEVHAAAASASAAAGAAANAGRGAGVAIPAPLAAGVGASFVMVTGGPAGDGPIAAVAGAGAANPILPRGSAGSRLQPRGEADVGIAVVTSGAAGATASGSAGTPVATMPLSQFISRPQPGAAGAVSLSGAPGSIRAPGSLHSPGGAAGTPNGSAAGTGLTSAGSGGAGGFGPGTTPRTLPGLPAGTPTAYSATPVPVMAAAGQPGQKK